MADGGEPGVVEGDRRERQSQRPRDGRRRRGVEQYDLKGKGNNEPETDDEGLVMSIGLDLGVLLDLHFRLWQLKGRSDRIAHRV